MFDTVQERGKRLKDSPMWKLMTMGGLVLLLLIPLGMVGSLIAERQERRSAAVNEVAATWGGAQTLGGPVLTVPVWRRCTDENGKVTRVKVDFQFLPETLRVEGKLQPERRSRGIFDAILYRAELRVTGAFGQPDLAQFPPEDVLWNEARLSLGLSDLRGLKGVGDLTWRGRPLHLEPGGREGLLWDSGLRTAVPGLAAGREGAVYPFALALVVDGSGTLEVLPVGKQTTLDLRSPWPDPSFVGKFLPDSRTVRPNGFQAAWSVPYYGRSYPQHWSTEEAAKVMPPGGLQASAFGVSLFLPVDSYQQTERSQKYAVLFLVLTFLTFFLYEMWSPVALHSVQYLLVGAALCLFYLLLLSISEHVPFGPSYAIAAAATVALISGYAWAILGGRGRALLLGAILAGLYGYLYVLLQAEDYALLLGSVGLFAILGGMMYLTRRINWYGKRPGAPERPEATVAA